MDFNPVLIDIPLENVCDGHEIFVCSFRENNFQLPDEDVVLERNFVNVVHRLHDV
jgi:hypothetical protein